MLCGCWWGFRVRGRAPPPPRPGLLPSPRRSGTLSSVSSSQISPSSSSPSSLGDRLTAFNSMLWGSQRRPADHDLTGPWTRRSLYRFNQQFRQTPSALTVRSPSSSSPLLLSLNYRETKRDFTRLEVSYIRKPDILVLFISGAMSCFYVYLKTPEQISENQSLNKEPA